jgi:hypothetical protein
VARLTIYKSEEDRRGQHESLHQAHLGCRPFSLQFSPFFLPVTLMHSDEHLLWLLPPPSVLLLPPAATSTMLTLKDYFARWWTRDKGRGKGGCLDDLGRQLENVSARGHLNI